MGEDGEKVPFQSPALPWPGLRRAYVGGVRGSSELVLPCEVLGSSAQRYLRTGGGPPACLPLTDAQGSSGASKMGWKELSMAVK